MPEIETDLICARLVSELGRYAASGLKYPEKVAKLAEVVDSYQNTHRCFKKLKVEYNSTLLQASGISTSNGKLVLSYGTASDFTASYEPYKPSNTVL